MLEGSCHCAAVRWQFDGVPDSATACNCTACRRYGTLWAYGYQDEGIRVSGPTEAYVRSDGDSDGGLGFHFCPNCGCVAYWRAVSPRAGRRRIAVNLRLADDPETVAAIAIRRFDGLGSFEDLPRDGRCVADMWF